MGCHLPPAAFQHRGHLHKLAHAAGERSVRLANVKTVLIDKYTPLIGGGQALTAGDGCGNAPAKLSVFPWIRVRQRLLEEENVEGFDGFYGGTSGIQVPSFVGTVSH